ncbi:restriction endonuclease subunit S [Candidatus Bathyarchaeota archaeon]|nr:restriction endonuclease subunit S [Candidatus Bathyarchaeota archaeon]
MNLIKFLKEADFQETPVGRISKDWGAKKVLDLFTVETGTTPSTKQKEFWDGGTVNWITPTDLSRLNGNIRIKSSERKITEKALKETNLSLMPRGSIIISTRAPVGYVAVLEDSATFNQGCKGLIPKNSEEISPEFYCYYLLSKKQILQNLSGGSTFKELSKDRLEQISLPYPPLEEQEAVVGVLGVVDSVIAKTGEVIAKIERLKKGLMQTLLTRGIGHKEYKQTPIGTTPKTWEVIKLGDVILEAKSGFASGKRDENGILQLRMDNIETEGWINPEAGVKVPTPSNVEKYILKPNDILFNNTNSVDLIGKTAIFRGELSKCVYSNHLTRIRVNLDRVIPEWILFVLLRKWQTGVFKAICHRHVHQAGINNSDLLNIKIPIPEIPEQQKIAQILSTTDKKLKLERSEKARLERIKQGLMGSLLTGKIRVKVM